MPFMCSLRPKHKKTRALTHSRYNNNIDSFSLSSISISTPTKPPAAKEFLTSLSVFLSASLNGILRRKKKMKIRF
ncbi:hypothetical protein MKX01_021454 [Papaver californicum]|nr:hypothetical protein MKX01_021454 [Papaver californicum]